MTREMLVGSQSDAIRDQFADICGTMLEIKTLENWVAKRGTTPEIMAELATLDVRLDGLMIAWWPLVLTTLGINEIRATLEWLGA